MVATLNVMWIVSFGQESDRERDCETEMTAWKTIVGMEENNCKKIEKE